jgi:hypothetical protein
MSRLIAWLFFIAGGAVAFGAQVPGAQRLAPNLESNIERPLRYRPDGADFVIENGVEFFNRSLYGGNTAFRVDGGDKPEFVLYLPGRGGNFRLGIRSAAGEAKWLHDAAKIETRYRPGQLRYELRDPVLGAAGVLRIEALAYHETEGLIVRATGEGVGAGVELMWAYGGVNGQRGARDGDIGTERVPISEWFQLKPEFCRENVITLGTERFRLGAKAATIVGLVPTGAMLRVADAAHWNDAGAMLAATAPATPSQPVVVGRVALVNGQARLISLQRVTPTAAANEDLGTYQAVTAPQAGTKREAPKIVLPPAYAAEELPRRFAETEIFFAALRSRVSVETPDAFLNAAVGALNVAADAVWDGPQEAIMQGAIAWRTKLLGWRGPYLLDALGRHDRARKNFEYWAGRQNTSVIPDTLPAPDEKTNLARNEVGLHSNGDMSNSHYDMNLVFIDALFRHLRWTGDLEFAKKMWPTIERHLAWERRLFRREFAVGAEKLPLYEAYAAIWASDDLQYHGGGTAHTSAYNYFHHREAARLAKVIGRGEVAAGYEREAELIARGMRELLWVKDAAGGWFAEYKDLLGLQRVHASAAVWSFYHTIDSEVPTPAEAWSMTRQIETQIPRIPVRGPGVPAGLHTVASSNWMPYTWSINNVVMAEAVHTALGFWQAGRADEAWRIAKGSLVAAMFMGITPGNVGSMSYLDVYRRESQRDFADGSGVLSRALIEGLFGVRPDALAGEMVVAPGWPADWAHAALRHPNVALEFLRKGNVDRYGIAQRFAKPQALRLRVAARGASVQATVNGRAVAAERRLGADGAASFEISATATKDAAVVLQWSGEVAARVRSIDASGFYQRSIAGQTSDPRWYWAPVELAPHFNDRVTQIFKNEYRSPRSPFVSLAMPKQGIGAWAGHVNETAEIDDAGLRAAAAKGGGKITLPGGVVFATPSAAEAKNVIFVSQWDNYPREATVPLAGRASRVSLLMAGSTNHMQSRFDNGEVVVTYADGSTERLAQENPTTWWPIEQDYFIDDFQFRVEGPLPVRVDLKTGAVRVLEAATFKGRGGKVPGGAATVLELPLNRDKELKSLTVRALANEVVIGLMAATLAR